MTDTERRLLEDNTKTTHRIEGILTGGNGGGLVKEVADAAKSRKEIHQDIERIEKNMVTKTDCAATRKGAGDKKDKALMRIKDFVLLTIGVLGLLKTLGVL